MSRRNGFLQLFCCIRSKLGEISKIINTSKWYQNLKFPLLMKIWRGCRILMIDTIDFDYIPYIIIRILHLINNIQDVYNELHMYSRAIDYFIFNQLLKNMSYILYKLIRIKIYINIVYLIWYKSYKFQFILLRIEREKRILQNKIS